MGKLLPFRRLRTSRRNPRRLEKIKEELLLYHGIDLDRLISSEPATNLTIEDFEELTDRILDTIDIFCEEHPSITIHDILYTLENVKDIIKASVEEE